MKLYCKIGFHKWHYYNQTLKANSNLPIIKSQILKNVPVRICRECMSKQYRLDIFNTYLNYDFFNKKWKKFNIYSKEEKREIQLRKIL